MEYRRLDEKALESFREGRGFKLLIVTVLAGIAIWIVSIFEFDHMWLKRTFQILLLLIEAGTIAEFIIYPKLEYKQWKYGISEDRVEIVHGIIFKNRTIIPIIRIQNIQVSQGPINRTYELFDVEIFTASGSFEIPCLNKEEADSIAEYLKNRIYKRLEEREGMANA